MNKHQEPVCKPCTKKVEILRSLGEDNLWDDFKKFLLGPYARNHFPTPHLRDYLVVLEKVIDLKEKLSSTTTIPSEYEELKTLRWIEDSTKYPLSLDGVLGNFNVLEDIVDNSLPIDSKSKRKFLQDQGAKLSPHFSGDLIHLPFAHSQSYLDELELLALECKPLDEETPLNLDILNAAKNGVSTALSSLNLLDKSRIVISVTGTPGHHASFNRNYGGLCYYNNAATLACRLTAKRINTAVLDLDSHFGNGTADIANLHKLPVIDLHEQTWASPFSEGGNPIQTNYTFSHPLAIASNRDLYLISLRKAIKRIRQLDLSVLIVSLGVDAHINDPFGLLALDTETYVEIGKELGSLLDSSNLKCIFLTEGGYGKLSPYLFALTVSEANRNLYKN